MSHHFINFPHYESHDIAIIWSEYEGEMVLYKLELSMQVSRLCVIHGSECESIFSIPSALNES